MARASRSRKCATTGRTVSRVHCLFVGFGCTGDMYLKFINYIILIIIIIIVIIHHHHHHHTPPLIIIYHRVLSTTVPRQLAGAPPH